MIRHVVLFRFHDDTPDRPIEALDAALSALPRQIPAILDYRHGRDLGITDGTWDYAVVGDFADEAAYRSYAGHPAHRDVITHHVEPILDVAVRAQIEI